MIILRIHFHKGAKPVILNLNLTGKTTIEEIADAGAKKLARGFKRYAPKISERSLQKYEFAQFMMLKIKLAEVINNGERR